MNNFSSTQNTSVQQFQGQILLKVDDWKVETLTHNVEYGIEDDCIYIEFTLMYDGQKWTGSYTPVIKYKSEKAYRSSQNVFGK